MSQKREITDHVVIMIVDLIILILIVGGAAVIEAGGARLNVLLKIEEERDMFHEHLENVWPEEER